MQLARFTIIATFILALISSTLLGLDASKVSPSLIEKNPSAGEWIDVVAILKNAPAKAPKFTATMLNDARDEKGHAMLVSVLKNQDVDNSAFVNRLRDLQSQGLVRNIQTYWIAAAASFSVDASMLDELTQSSDLEFIIDDQPLELVAPVAEASTSSGIAGASGYMSLIGARDLWNMGYTGHGRLVCSFDTGVEGTHPALSTNWKGNSVPATQAWFDPYGSVSPVDGAGHGTHTMGLMVGRDGADTIGVAFNAQWMSAAVIDRGQSLNKTVSDIIGAFQWAADPDGNPQTVSDLPDVVCNSWGIPKGLLEPCDQTFWQAIDNLEALGVVVIFACGNEGPNPSTIRNPADRSAALNSFSIGAVDQSRTDLPVATFSSRGPANCDATKIKPEMVGPGVSLRSSYKNGSYRLMSGTSMAAPVIAGCVALLREYNPAATVAEIKSALLNSVTDLGALGQDNDYGYGFVNVKKAIDFLPAPIKPRIFVDHVSLSNNSNAVLEIGNTTELNLTVSNSSINAAGMHAVLHSSNPNIFILNSEVTFGNVPSAALVGNDTDPFMVKVAIEATAGEIADFTVDFYGQQQGYLNSADFSIVIGQPVVAGTNTVATQRLNMEVTNFGLSRRFYDSSFGKNTLSSLSLMISDINGNVYDALPGEIDYWASSALELSQDNGITEIQSAFTTIDDALHIKSKVSVNDTPGKRNFVLVEYNFPEAAEAASLQSVALGCDFDLDEGESVHLDNGDFVFRSGDQQQYIGIRVIPAGSTFGTCIDAGLIKAGLLSDATKLALLTPGMDPSNETAMDNALIAGINGFSLEDSKPLKFAYVIASGSNLDEIKAALQAGQGMYSQATDADDETDEVLPQSFVLEQNYPNPFNAETQIAFNLPKAGDYRLDIFNSLGQLVKSVSVENATAGPQHVIWDGTTSTNSDVASGIYFYRLSFEGSSETRKMVLLK